MSKHRIKNITFEGHYESDEDQSYSQSDYIEEDGVTAEDEEKLRAGTANVRTALGPDYAFIPNKEIQGTLWHYYYEVSRSVNYLKNKHTPRPSQSNRAKTKLDKAATQPPKPASSGLGHLVVESSADNGKMSKIAALAAKRRQKENEKHKVFIGNMNSLVKESASNSKRLEITTEDIRETSKESLLQPRRDMGPKTRLSQTQERGVPGETPYAPSQQPKDKRADVADEPDQVHSAADAVDLCAKPSMFALTLMDFSENGWAVPCGLSPSLPEPVFSSFDFSRPSPDDVVLRAQTFKGSKPPATVNQQISTRPKESLSHGMKSLSIAEPTKIKSKNLDVVAEYRKVKRKNAANFVVVGHVDAGKSTLMGRLLFDLKAVDERTMDKYRKQADSMGKGSFALAWILDEGTEERARGVTIDIATNKFETDRTSFTILDAPGHRDFVANMIAGASQADFAVLVIDASPGEFESGLKGQTKEHTLLVRSIGVSKIVVAVNKMDRANWSEERFQDIQQQMLAFLITAGFKRENVSFVPCSGLLGHNILHRTTTPQAEWYSGKTLLEELDTCEPTSHALDKPLRMMVGDVFHGSLQNPLSISGRIEAGSLQVGDQVMVMPRGEQTTIRAIQVDGEPSDWAVAGQNVVLHITEIDPAQIKLGDMLCKPATPVSNVTSFTAKVLAFQHLTPMPLDVHRGRMHVAGKISSLVAVLSKADGSIVKQRPKIVQPGSIATVVVELNSAAPLEGGRIVLRANGETVAAGVLQ